MAVVSYRSIFPSTPSLRLWVMAHNEAAQQIALSVFSQAKASPNPSCSTEVPTSCCCVTTDYVGKSMSKWLNLCNQIYKYSYVSLEQPNWLFPWGHRSIIKPSTDRSWSDWHGMAFRGSLGCTHDSVGFEMKRQRADREPGVHSVGVLPWSQALLVELLFETWGVHMVLERNPLRTTKLWFF